MTATNNSVYVRKYAMMGGDSTGAIKLANTSSYPPPTSCELFDGTNWSATGAGVSAIYAGGMGGNGS